MKTKIAKIGLNVFIAVGLMITILELCSTVKYLSDYNKYVYNNYVTESLSEDELMNYYVRNVNEFYNRTKGENYIYHFVDTDIKMWGDTPKIGYEIYEWTPFGKRVVGEGIINYSEYSEWLSNIE